MDIRTHTIARICGLFCGAALLLSTAACATEAPTPQTQQSPSNTNGKKKQRRTPKKTTPHAHTAPEIKRVMDVLQKQMNSSMGIAIVPVGNPEVGGATGKASDIAWSTIKIPIAIAATRAGTADSEDVVDAITVSDNDAAYALFESLGTVEEAANATDSVLRDGGDRTTTVPTDVEDGEYIGFGETEWSLHDQAVFGSSLPCMTNIGDVYQQMSHIDDNQSWGLGRISGAHFKGGWGPTDDGYLVRQFGVVDVPDGQVAIAIIASDEDYDTAVESLNKLVDMLAPELSSLHGGHCAAKS